MMNLDSIVLKNGNVYYKGHICQQDVLIENGIVTNIAKNLTAQNTIDCTNKLVCSTFIDMHVHLRSPGQTHKEDINSGTSAALKGGFATVCSMPNTLPTLDNTDKMKDYLAELAITQKCEVLPFSAATIGLKGKQLVDIENLANLKIAGFSDDGRGIQDDKLMKELLIRAGKVNKLVSAHCEDEIELGKEMGCINCGSISDKHQLKGITDKSEYKMIERDLRIIDDIHQQCAYQYHVCHISCETSLEVIKKAKQKGHHVTCEVTPHHLISSQEEIDINDSNYKMNPPLRTKKDVLALQAGLVNGDIDVIATDHAPHSTKEKSVAFQNAPFGIIGLELAFSLLNTYLVKTQRVALENILKALIDNPAKILKLNPGLEINQAVSINIIDLEKDIIYTADQLKSKSQNTFYLNRELKGVVEKTIIKDKGASA